MAETSVLKIVDGAHDGRQTETIQTGTRVEVDLAGGGTEEIKVTLELVRPQTIASTWSEFSKEAEAEAVRKVESDTLKAQWKAENDAVAFDVSSRLAQLLGEPTGGYDFRSERRDCHRTSTSSGRSSTYAVSEETLLKLIALAEKASGE